MSQNFISDGFTVVYTSGKRPPFDTGETKEVGGFKYRFVQCGATTATAAYPAVYVATNPQSGDWDVTADLSAGNAEGCFAGIVMAELGPYEYGWLLIDGIYETCTMKGACTKGNAVIVDADGAADGGFDPAVDTGLLAICGVNMEGCTAAATGQAIWIKAL